MKQNRTSHFGMMYDKVQKEYDENVWIREIVESIETELLWQIQVEKYKLPLNALFGESTLPLTTSDEDTQKVVYALKVKGIVATPKTDYGFVHFSVEDLT